LSGTAPTDGVLTVRATVRNTGPRAGTMVPQVYLTDPVASVARPVRQLIGFTRVHLEPDQTAQLSVDISTDLASFTDRCLHRVVEPGTVIVTIAQSAGDPGVSAAVELVGATRRVDHHRVMSSSIDFQLAR
jgi:beta-glucosidase